MTAGGWFGLAMVAWNLLWSWALWWSECQAAARFRKRMLNRYRQPWE